MDDQEAAERPGQRRADGSPYARNTPDTAGTPGGSLPPAAPAGRGAPLAGRTVGVTAARRAEELGALLERRGAAVLHAPALRIVPLADDTALRAATEQLVRRAPDVVVVTTAIGFRGWVGAADGWGLGEALRDRLRAASLLARGPKVKGAVRAAGLTEEWSPSSESMAEVRDRLLAQGVAGRRVAVQLHGEPSPGFAEALRADGAEVVEVPVYRWLPPADPGPVDRLLDATVAGEVDALTFTSAPAVTYLLRRAEQRHLLPDLLAALRHDVLAACVGPVTAAPLQVHGVPTAQPDRFRLGPLVHLLCREVPGRPRVWPVAGRRVVPRGRVVLVDGAPRPLPPAESALLRALLRRPGAVVDRAELLRALPGAGHDGPALDTALARLRTALGAPETVETVPGRGHRLAVDPGTRPAAPEPAGERAG